MQGPYIPELGAISAVLNLNCSLNLFVSQNIISQEQPNASFLKRRRLRVSMCVKSRAVKEMLKQ
jgi:hypothetical protein